MRSFTFDSIKKAIEELNKLLNNHGSETYIAKLKRRTRELLGIQITVNTSDYNVDHGESVQRKVANLEIESAFKKALRILEYDETARYAIGIPDSFAGSINPPCLVSCQLLKRSGKINGIFYFRSLDVEEFSKDLGWIGLLLDSDAEYYNKEVTIFAGSFHKYVD